MGYVDINHTEEGVSVFVEIRNKKAEATVTKPPFVK
jgi:glycine cleavage system aminomethyltransferase T